MSDWKKAQEDTKRFLDANKLQPTDMKLRAFGRRLGLYVETGGFVTNGNLFVDVVRCDDNGFMSHVGAMDDHTVRGVTAHEIGHHVWHCVCPKPRQQQLMTQRWKEIIIAEREVSNYKSFNAKEAFAEACRLFILNPDLLQLGWPMRYKCMVEEMEMVAIEKREWREVLEGADEFHHVRIRRLLSCK